MLRTIFDWVLTLVLAVIIALGVRTYVAEARWIPTGSMLPTLQIGDRLIIDKVYYKFTGIQRGDIVIFNPPPESHESEVMIKRVIGLPGDQIKIRDGVVKVNGKALTEPYELEKPRGSYNLAKVPAGSYFVMGDNRNNSFDSRFWGTVPAQNVIGRAVFKYYPLNEISVLK